VAEPTTLLRDARRRAGLTQQQLALRLGVSQAAIAKLERPGANPTLRTLTKALRATGHRLTMQAIPRTGGVDESLIRQHLELSPAERLRGLETMHSQGRALARAGARSRGERV
jgi:transcriptional regulator with XRE-family HTH domain